MSIRIGSSCALSTAMAIGNVVETRILFGKSDWQEVSKYCIKNKKYLIVTPCVNTDTGKPYIPNADTWLNIIENTCKFLKSIGGNRFNCRISLINEPMKWLKINEYVNLINLAYPVVKKYGFLCGAGNEEFITAQARGNMYEYILQNAQFDILDIHIQGSCDNIARTKYWTRVAYDWWIKYKKPLDCTEAFYNDIATSDGWELLKTQMTEAEKIGCQNFCNVFNNLDRNAFPSEIRDIVNKWQKLSFCVDGVMRSKYYPVWLALIDLKAPNPNIIEQKELDDMKLYVLKRGVKGNFVAWLQEILEIEYNFENDGGWDGIFGAKTEEQVKQYQQANGLKVDGIVGKYTTADLILKSSKPDYWLTKLQIYIGFEK